MNFLPVNTFCFTSLPHISLLNKVSTNMPLPSTGESLKLPTVCTETKKVEYTVMSCLCRRYLQALQRCAALWNASNANEEAEMCRRNNGKITFSHTADWNSQDIDVCAVVDKKRMFEGCILSLQQLWVQTPVSTSSLTRPVCLAQRAGGGNVCRRGSGCVNAVCLVFSRS